MEMQDRTIERNLLQRIQKLHRWGGQQILLGSALAIYYAIAITIRYKNGCAAIFAVAIMIPIHLIEKTHSRIHNRVINPKCE